MIIVMVWNNKRCNAILPDAAIGASVAAIGSCNEVSGDLRYSGHRQGLRRLKAVRDRYWLCNIFTSVVFAVHNMSLEIATLGP